MKTFESVKNKTNRVQSSSRAEIRHRDLLPGPSGERAKNAHAASHKNPSSPIAMKALCQPRRNTNQAMSGGEITAPIDAPLLKIPEARARSCEGNHSLKIG